MGAENDLQVKRMYSVEQRRALLKKNPPQVRSDLSFPIADREDLSNAIHAIGRTNPAHRLAVKAWIKKRAAALGATDMVSGDAWKDDSENVEVPEVQPEEKAAIETAEQLVKAIEEYGDSTDDAQRAILVKAARSLSLESSLPADWTLESKDDEDESAAKMLTLEEINEKAATELDGKVLDSVYAPASETFLVIVERNSDHSPIEAMFSKSGELDGWYKMDPALLDQKTEVSLISATEAADIAVKTVEGTAVGVDSDTLDGVDLYIVDVKSEDGTSFDVFVGLDGKVLGFDEYAPEVLEGSEEKTEPAPVEGGESEGETSESEEEEEIAPEEKSESVTGDLAEMLAGLAEIEMISTEIS